MDFATAPCILNVVSQWLAHGMFGCSRWQNEVFLGATAHWHVSRFNSVIDPQTVVYGPSVTYTAAETIRQWSSEGDGAVIHTPVYGTSYNTITANRREITPVPSILTDNQRHRDMTRLESALVELKNTLLLLCSPHSPTRKVWRRKELQIMSALHQRHGVGIISGEIHIDMTWDEHRHIPQSEVAQGPWALFIFGLRSFNIPTFTGTYGSTPKVNARDSYLRALKTRDRLSSPSVSALIAHIVAYRDGAPWLDALCDYLQTNMHYVAATLNDASLVLYWQPPEATYLAWIDLRPLNIGDHTLWQALVAEQKVAIMSGYTYGSGGNGLLRLNVGCPRGKLERGVEGLIAALCSLSWFDMQSTGHRASEMPGSRRRE